MSRRVNALNITPVSIQRIDYNSDFGDVKGYVMDNITTAINDQTGSFKVYFMVVSTGKTMFSILAVLAELEREPTVKAPYREEKR